MERDQLFEQYRRLARGVASGLANRGIPMQDLIDEAESHLGLLISDDSKCRFDPEYASRSTWFHIRIRWHLLRFIQNHGKHRPMPLPVYAAQLPSKGSGRLAAMLQSLGSEAAEVVHMILDAPAEIAAEMRPRNARQATAKLREYLNDRCGWDADKIDTVFNEVRNGLA